jgi:hypothetical protein
MKSRFRYVFLAFPILIVALVVSLGVGVGAQNGPKDKYEPPTLGYGGVTGTSINITVTAGDTGCSGGFVIHWREYSDFEEYGWEPCLDGLKPCNAGFSGQASGSRYALTSGQSVTVTIGESFLYDAGAGIDEERCEGALECGTKYIFRAFCQARDLRRSDWSGNLTVSTTPCGDDGCTLTQGYWKNHLEAWPVEGLYLGNEWYSKESLLSILGQPVQGNGLVALAYQLIAAKLNVENGADPSEIEEVIEDADDLIAGQVVPPVGTGYLHPSLTSGLVDLLTRYNEGAIGPGHCSITNPE